jgi:hypothetical protein
MYIIMEKYLSRRLNYERSMGHIPRISSTVRILAGLQVQFRVRNFGGNGPHNCPWLGFYTSPTLPIHNVSGGSIHQFFATLNCPRDCFVFSILLIVEFCYLACVQWYQSHVFFYPRFLKLHAIVCLRELQIREEPPVIV